MRIKPVRGSGIVISAPPYITYRETLILTYFIILIKVVTKPTIPAIIPKMMSNISLATI